MIKKEGHSEFVESPALKNYPSPGQDEKDNFDFCEKEQIKVRPKVLFTNEFIEKATRVHKIRWNRIFYQCYFFFVGVALIFLSSHSLTDYSSYVTDYTYITNNWRNDYFTNISLSQSSSLCATDYDESYIEMISYLWPGTNDGCDCSQQTTSNNTRFLLNFDESVDELSNTLSNVYQQIHVGTTCSTQELQQHCQTVDKLIPKPLQLWNDGLYGSPIRLCGKVESGINFANSAPSSEAGCDPGLIQCGSGDQLFCVPSTSACPINYVGFYVQNGFGNEVWNQQLRADVVTQFNLIKNLTNAGNFTQAFQLGGVNQIDDMFYLFFLKNLTGYSPLSEIKVSQAFNESGVCFTSNISNIDTHSLDYPLMVTARNNCATDPRYQIFHQINEYQFYLGNNFIYVQQDLPAYSIDDTKSWGIFFRGYIEWKAHCRGPLFQQCISEGDSLIDIQNAQAAQFIISIIYFITISVIFSVLSCLSSCGMEWSCIDFQKKKQSDLIFLVEGVLKLMIQFTQFGLVIWTFTITYKKKNFLQKVIDQQCSDIYTQQFFIRLLTLIQKDFFIYNLAIIILFSFTFLVDIFVLMQVLRTRSEKKKLSSKKDYQEVVPNDNEGNKVNQGVSKNFQGDGKKNQQHILSDANHDEGVNLKESSVVVSKGQPNQQNSKIKSDKTTTPTNSKK